MTDNDVIKALECCNQDSSKGCFRCPYRQYSPACLEKRNADTIDLINRQQVEIERLRKDNGIVDILYQEEQAQNEDLKTEIERLKKGWKADVIEAQNIKAEAIKEFTKRLNKEAEEVVIDREGDFVFANDKLYETVADWCKETSNNLTKEMVGAYSNETQKETETGK